MLSDFSGVNHCIYDQQYLDVYLRELTNSPDFSAEIQIIFGISFQVIQQKHNQLKDII